MRNHKIAKASPNPYPIYKKEAVYKTGPPTRGQDRIGARVVSMQVGAGGR